MHKCHGRWALIPELSFYDRGESPLHCTYEIDVDGLDVAFKLTWLQSDERELVIEFGGTADSKPAAVDGSHGAEASHTWVSDRVLESRMFVAGTEKAYAKRVVSSDGQLMAVLQINTTDSGDPVPITQVYQRVIQVD